MNILRYSQWTQTALTLHLISQMMGKTKLAHMEPQPEWNHIVLPLTAHGFSSGLIPYGEKAFFLEMNLREGHVMASSIDGQVSSFVLKNGTSISEYYTKFMDMLAEIQCETSIYTVPMEMGLTTPFENMHDQQQYRSQQAMDFFYMCVFAHNAILQFVSPFRGKRMLPALFWGTFDITGVLFNGTPVPFAGNGGIIEKVAFDEQMIEFGFWPGDGETEEPSFFILPYPFIATDLSREPIKPDKALFSKEKGEFFFSLRDALSYPNPQQAVLDFFRSGYHILTRTEQWEGLEWFTLPLLARRGSNALKG